jgi:hypothetical protein
MLHTPQNQSQVPASIIAGHDPRQGVRFVARVLGPSTLAPIHQDGGPPTAFYLNHDNTEAAEAWVEKMNSTHNMYNIYYTGNETTHGFSKKAAKADVTGLRIVGADVDAKNGRAMERALADAQAVPIPPSCIVMTGGGFQPIWVLPEVLPPTDENIRRIEALGKRIAELVGGDAIQNIDRIFRMPFTLNYPNARKRAEGREICATGLVGGLP